MSTRCPIDSRYLFSPGDEYTVRYMQTHTGPVRQLKAIAHHYIQAIPAGRNCFFTFGLRTDRKLRFRIKTLLQGPDFLDLSCSHKLNQCLRSNGPDCQNECTHEGIMDLPDGRKAYLGHVITSGHLNSEQARIMNLFLELSQKKSSASGSTSWREFNLPFAFSVMSSCSMLSTLTGDQDYNCQKFVQMFHAQPQEILRFLDPQYTKPVPFLKFMDYYASYLINVCANVKFTKQQISNIIQCGIELGQAAFHEPGMRDFPEVPDNIIISTCAAVMYTSVLNNRPFTTPGEFMDLSGFPIEIDQQDPNWREIAEVIEPCPDNKQYADDVELSMAAIQKISVLLD